MMAAVSSLDYLASPCNPPLKSAHALSFSSPTHTSPAWSMLYTNASDNEIISRKKSPFNRNPMGQHVAPASREQGKFWGGFVSHIRLEKARPWAGGGVLPFLKPAAVVPGWANGIPLSRVFALLQAPGHFHGKFCCPAHALLEPAWASSPIFHRKIGLFFKENKGHFQASTG